MATINSREAVEKIIENNGNFLESVLLEGAVDERAEELARRTARHAQAGAIEPGERQQSQ